MVDENVAEAAVLCVDVPQPEEEWRLAGEEVDRNQTSTLPQLSYRTEPPPLTLEWRGLSGLGVCMATIMGQVIYHSVN